MKTPKYIDNLLTRRRVLAEKLCIVSSQIDEWLEKNGFDLADPDINDAVITGCMIYAEPDVAERILRDAIEKK